MHTYKISIIGGPQSGKTTFIKKLRVGEFEHRYIPTMGVDVHPINFQNDEGMYCLNTWDTSGNPTFRGLGNGYYRRSDGAIAFYTSNTIDITNQLINDYTQICPNTPIINIWNKCDLASECNLHPNTLQQGNRTTYLISCLGDSNLQQPLFDLIQMIV